MAFPPKQLTVAIDGSAYADHGLTFAIDLAKRYDGALTIVAVAPLVPMFMGPNEQWVPSDVPVAEVEHYRALIDKAVHRAQSEGLPHVTGVALEGVVVDEILGHIEEHPPDLLIMGSRGLSTAKRLLLGSVSEAVLHHVRCPVLLVRTPP
jgi:nucleotide-binding universal stress UspA family protein